MTLMRFRLLGSRADVDDVITRLHGLDKIDHVEELDTIELTEQVDSSSSDLVSDRIANAYVIEVEAPDDETADQVRVAAESAAFARNAGIEFINDF